MDPRSLRAARGQGLHPLDKRLGALGEGAGFGQPVVHLGVDVDGVVAAPGGAHMWVPDALEVGRGAARAGAADEEVAAVLEKEGVKPRVVGPLADGAEPREGGLLLEGRVVPEVELHPVKQGGKIGDMGKVKPAVAPLRRRERLGEPRLFIPVRHLPKAHEARADAEAEGHRVRPPDGEPFPFGAHRTPLGLGAERGGEADGLGDLRRVVDNGLRAVVIDGPCLARAVAVQAQHPVPRVNAAAQRALQRGLRRHAAGAVRLDPHKERPRGIGGEDGAGIAHTACRKAGGLDAGAEVERAAVAADLPFFGHGEGEVPEREVALRPFAEEKPVGKRFRLAGFPGRDEGAHFF